MPRQQEPALKPKRFGTQQSLAGFAVKGLSAELRADALLLFLGQHHPGIEIFTNTQVVSVQFCQHVFIRAHCPAFTLHEQGAIFPVMGKAARRPACMMVNDAAALHTQF